MDIVRRNLVLVTLRSQGFLKVPVTFRSRSQIFKSKYIKNKSVGPG